MNTNPPIAQLQGICKSYGRGHAAVTALRDINLTLYPGQLTLIEGPSGCGKTTLLEILGLLLPPNQGQVLIHNRRASGLGQGSTTRLRRRHVAFVFQDFNLLESLGAHDNIAMVARLHGWNARRRTKEALQTLGLTHRARHRPSELSGGEKQRVAIGRALVSNAGLLLADEPTANLDWSIGQSIVRTLSNIARTQGRSVVVVSHDPRLEPFADRVVTLRDGRIVGQRRGGRGGRATSLIVSLLAILATAAAGWIMTTNARLQQQLGPRIENAARAGWMMTLSEKEKHALETLHDPRPPEPTEVVVAAAPGVTEPVSKTIQLSCDRPGIITAINVESGRQITKGQLLVQLDSAEAQANCVLTQAQLASANAALDDLKAWTRPEEIDQARAAVEADTARTVFAEAEYERLTKLHASGAGVVNDVDRAKQNLDVSKALLHADEAVLARDLKGPTPTALAQAQSRITEAAAAVDVARTALERRCLRSPVDGVVLYVYKRPGEAIDMESPQPILSLAEAGPMRVRADVDESDIGRIYVGQKVLATSESIEGTFAGTVISMEPIMGRRNILTNRPRDRQDTRIREVVIQMQNDVTRLPVDLMMTVRFLREPISKRNPATTEASSPSINQ